MCARLRRSPAEGGFTILEVLVAFVVLALALAALMQIFSGGLREAQVADEYARATLVAQSKVAGVAAVDKLEEGESRGTEDGFAWTLLVAPYDERDEAPEADRNLSPNVGVRLLKVESDVAWRAADGRDRHVRLATLILVGKR
jgi:general secretion pathway protein I